MKKFWNILSPMVILVLCSIAQLIFIPDAITFEARLMKSLIFFLFALLLIFLFNKNTFPTFKRLKGKAKFSGVLLGLAIVISLVLSLSIFFSFSINHSISLSLHSLLFTALSFFIMACGEELIFRGFTFEKIIEYKTPTSAIFTIAVLNTTMGLLTNIQNPIYYLNSFLVALLLTILYYKYSSLANNILTNFILKLSLYLIVAPKGIELFTGDPNALTGGLLFSILILVSIVAFCVTNKLKLEIRAFPVIVSFLLFLLLGAYLSIDIKAWSTKALQNSSTPILSIKKDESLVHYKMNWVISKDSKLVSGVQTVNYINKSKDNLKEIYFHIYPAAFVDYKGNITINNVTVDNKKVTFATEGSDKTLLNVTLPSTLKSLERVSILISYKINIPERSNNGFADRFALGENTLNLGNIFPIAAVYENGKWDKHPYDRKGDAFYSECSNFDVTVTAPKGLVLAVTGNILSKVENDDSTCTYIISANSVRDFAVVGSYRFQLNELNVNGTIIKAYTFDKRKSHKILEFSKNALLSLNKRFGVYPYQTLSVVETDLNGGMEYPNLVMITTNGYNNLSYNSLWINYLYGSPMGALEYVVVHEIAHQWWYGIVGNDEFNEAWLDEPITQFSTLLYFKDIYGAERFQKTFTKAIGYGNEYVDPNVDFKKSLDKFNDRDYTWTIYREVPFLIKLKYEALGDEKFNQLFRKCFNKYKFKILKGNEFPLDI